jgi:hypothetical protein
MDHAVFFLQFPPHEGFVSGQTVYQFPFEARNLAERNIMGDENTHAHPLASLIMIIGSALIAELSFSLCSPASGHKGRTLANRHPQTWFLGQADGVAFHFPSA